MSDPLPVHLNRTELHGLEVPTDFEASGGFDVLLVNHGEPTHVHLHLDDSLSALAELEATNHYVKAETERLVQVVVTGEGTTRGKLKIVSAHGAQTRYVDVEITDTEPEERTVLVDEELAKPQPRTDPDSGGPLPDSLGVTMLAIGGVALLTAVVATVVLQNGAVLLGSLAVLAAVLVTLYVLLTA